MEEPSYPSTTDLILSEAYERQLQILLLGSQEAASLTKKIVSLAKANLDEQFNLRRKETLVQQRIARSEIINHQRMLIITRNLCEQIFHQVELRLQALATEVENENQYKLFLIESIVDGLVRMFENKIYIRCREKDVALFKELLPLCVSCYQEYMQEQIGISYQIDLSIAGNMTLEQRTMQPYKPLPKSKEDSQCIGGVILADETGNITFKATFDSRMNILKDISLPDIRASVWGIGSRQQSSK